MKPLFIPLLLFTSTIALGQSKNDQLYKAVTSSEAVKVETLLNQGADPNSKKKVGFFELSLLIWTAQHEDVKIAKLLIEHKAEVDWKDGFKTTALMYAAHSGNLAMIKLLLDHGADPNAKDEQGNSVLSAAKESKNEDAIKLIESLQKN